MKNVKLGNFLFLEIPKNAYDFDFRRNNELVYLLKDVINPLTNSEKSEILDIPDTKYGFTIKDWVIFCTSDYALKKENLACSILIDYRDKFNGLYLCIGSDYTTDMWVDNKGTLNSLVRTEYLQPIQALEYFITHNLDINKRYIILEKI